MRPETVWLATRGDNGEGMSIVGIYATKEAATKAVLSEKAHNEGGWMPVNEDETSAEWDNYCDGVRIEQCEVHP